MVALLYGSVSVDSPEAYTEYLVRRKINFHFRFQEFHNGFSRVIAQGLQAAGSQAHVGVGSLGKEDK